MSAFLNANEIREQVSIVDLLARLGFAPAHRSGKELFYLSMLRDEKTASLCVNEQLGIWYDHGGPNRSGIKGGNVIDLGLAYWHPLSFPEVLAKIKDTCQLEISGAAASADNARKARPRLAIKLPNYKIEDIKPLGSNPAITGYLQYRGVWEAAGENLKEIYYYVEDDKKNRKPFFAAGWQNENGGWEVRNKYFKGCLGKKGMSFIQGDNNVLAVFEGYLDFLSWKPDLQTERPGILILNSLSFISGAIERARNYREVDVFFDLDPSGRQAAEQLMTALPQAKDRSGLYIGYKDYNEKHMAELAALSNLRPVAAPGIFAGVKVSFSR
ncbi:MAG: toprim domain-containing protein [Bacteroidota bacterium]